MKFEWDPAKDDANRIKHSIGFEEAATVFGDRSALSSHSTLFPLSPWLGGQKGRRDELAEEDRSKAGAEED